MTADEKLAHEILLEIERRIHTRAGKVTAEVSLALSEAHPDILMMVRAAMDDVERDTRSWAATYWETFYRGGNYCEGDLPDHHLDEEVCDHD